MPLRLGNYGEWEGDRPGGHHPPACTCYECNEGRNRRNAAETSARYDARLRAVQRRRTLTETRRSTNATVTPRRTPTRHRFGALLAFLIVCGMLVGIGYALDFQNWRTGPDIVSSPNVSAPKPTRAPVIPVAPPTMPPPTTPSRDPYHGVGDRDAPTIEEKIIEYTNHERVRRNLVPMIPEPTIQAIAVAHSRNMMEQQSLSHVLDGKDPTTRAGEALYRCRTKLPTGQITYGLAENIAKHPQPWNAEQAESMYGHTDADLSPPEAAARRLVRGWMESPGHRDNITNPIYRRIGVGVAIESPGSAIYATQNFSACKD